jgi:hypothetical protein
MAIDVRQKGAEGERQVYKMLNDIIVEVMAAMAFPAEDIEKAKTMVQRNQNQSAVGGNDLTNTFGMSIEVKRQEQLSVNTWWEQCKKAAEKNNELPVLMYRQNRKPWRIRTYTFLHVPSKDGGWGSVQAVAEFDEATFKSWFRAWVIGKLSSGAEFRT